MKRAGWLLYALIWLALGASYAFVIWSTDRAALHEAVLSGLYQFGIAGLLGLLVWRVTARVHPTQRSVPLHFLFAVVYSALWLGSQYVYLLVLAPSGVADTVLRLSGPWQMLYGSFLYGCVAAGSYAVRATRALREQQLAAARAQAAALRAQLNPHFLFNALNSVTALVRRDPAGAESALVRLSELLRYALDEASGETVALEEEWRFSRAYLDLEQLRLGERLRVDAQVADDALACDVPPFVLQPLIENAVRHGIAPRPAGGSVAIRASRSNGRLLLSVRDDGPGAESGAVERAAGVGLRAVKGLVAARDDGQGGVSVETAPGQGFTVSIDIPAASSS